MNTYVFWDAKKETNTTIIKSGIHIIFITVQLEKYKRKPADKDPIPWVEKTIKSFNPWAVNLSFSSYETTNKLDPETNKKFQPIPSNIKPNI